MRRAAGVVLWRGCGCHRQRSTAACGWRWMSNSALREESADAAAGATGGGGKLPSVEQLLPHLERLEARYTALVEQLSSGALAAREIGRVSREVAELEAANAHAKELRRVMEEQAATREMMEEAEAQEDTDMLQLAREEMATLLERENAAVEGVVVGVVERDPEDGAGAIVEVRAGTGGDEAALFAMDILRMYENLARTRGWQQEVLSMHTTDIGGCKEAALRFDSDHDGVFGTLKYENGVHRVQRVPVNDSRIHTSAMTVVVFPQAAEDDASVPELDMSEVRIDTYRSSGSGGQHVNTTDSAVRATHIPTGLVAAIQNTPSQHKNKKMALQLLRSRVHDYHRREQAAKVAQYRSSLVGGGDRSQRIRTYNWPQDRIVDHRIGYTMHGVQEVLAGTGLEPLLRALTKADMQERVVATFSSSESER